MNYRIERWEKFEAPNPAMLRHLMTAENYRVYHWCDQPERVYGNHKHAEEQSHWIISGTLELTIEKVGIVTLKAGDRDFMPANLYHSARVVGDEPVIYLVGEKIR